MLTSRLSLSIRWLACAWLLGVQLLMSATESMRQNSAPKFNVIALAEANSIHRPFVNAAKIWLQKQAAENNFSVEYVESTDKIDDAFLSRFRLFIQLDYPPYGWTPKAVAAFTKYIEEGRGGWIGFHHATLLGEFDGYPMWPWFSQFMGGIRFTNYIPKFATGTVVAEDRSHAVMTNIASSFVVEQEEWYTYDKSPRSNVHVLAHVDELTGPRDEQERRLHHHLRRAHEGEHRAVGVGAGIDVEQTTASGQPEVRDWEQSYLQDGHFEQDAMLHLVEAVLKSNAASGYPLTRILAHMEWALLDNPGVDDLDPLGPRLPDVELLAEGLADLERRQRGLRIGPEGPHDRPRPRTPGGSGAPSTGSPDPRTSAHARAESRASSPRRGSVNAAAHRAPTR